MLLLLGVAFVAGIVTAVSPCVLPVLPIVLAGGATGGKRRPYAIVAGLVASFTVFTLTAAALLSALGLPDDLLRNLAIAVVVVVGVSLLWAPLGELLSRPFQRLSRRHPGDAGGFVLGVSLGLIFTPCAGPVIGAVATVAATRDLGLEAVLITLAYALGAGLVLLGVAIGAQRGMNLAPVRAHAPLIRRALGVGVLVVAVLMIYGVDRDLRTRVPEYTKALQSLEESAKAQSQLQDLVGTPGLAREERLDDYGKAPDFTAIEEWINSRPLTMAGLRGKVVLLDFWTYSCINCLRTLPYIRGWYDEYRGDGLVVVGVHTPEFAFEREEDNVRRAVRDQRIEYPVALDNEFGTWQAFQNRYWPAKYFVDRRGRLRFAHFGEGAYDESEAVIRQLLAEDGSTPADTARVSGGESASAGEITPESYLGFERLDRYAGSPLRPGTPAAYSFPRTPLALHQLAFDGRWRIEGERAVAGVGARLRLRFQARDVHLVLSGRGPVQVLVDGSLVRTVRVDGDRLYTLVRGSAVREGLLELQVAPGVAAYAFTFG